MVKWRKIPLGRTQLSKREQIAHQGSEDVTMERKIPIAEPSLGDEELKLITEAVRSGWISSKGKFIPEFEEKFAKYCTVKHGIATSNGTNALHLALVALNIGKGDEVIIPTLTFVATANVVRYTGAKCVFADSDPQYWCIDPKDIEKKITKRTKAIIPVHLYGHPCDMDLIMESAREHDLHVVEDCAESHGALYRNRFTGSFGDISCYSFYGNKIITTGEGGMCLTNDDVLAEKLKILRDHGMDPKRKFWHTVIGFNYRMTNLQAAIGVAQIGKIERFVEKKREIAEAYNKKFRDIDFVSLPPEMPWAKNVYWMYSLLLHDGLGIDRDQLMEKLRRHNVETRPFFAPIHTMPHYNEGKGLPVAEDLARRGINLPSGVTLTESDITKVANVVR